MSKKKRKYQSPIEAHIPLTFDTLTICWEARTVTFRGRTIGPIEGKCLAIPVTNEEHLLIRAGYVPWQP